MLSLTVHALLAFVVIGSPCAPTRRSSAVTATGPLLSPFELALYGVGIASIIGGWTFNVTLRASRTPTAG